MAYPCQDCGKVLATQGGLDVHRAQWCAGLNGGGAPAERPGRLRRRDRRRQERQRAAPPPAAGQAGAPDAYRRGPRLVPLNGGRSEPAVAAAAAAPEPPPKRGRHDGAAPSAVASAPSAVAAAPSAVTAEPGEQGDGTVDLLAPAIDLRDTDERIELSLIMWLMRRRAHRDRLPRDRTVVRFNFTGSRAESYWLVLDAPDVSLLAAEPRVAADVVVNAEASAFKRVFQGRMLLADALHDDLIRLEGPEALVQSLPRWFDWSNPLATAGG